jgi:hypothetical protein
MRLLVTAILFAAAAGFAWAGAGDLQTKTDHPWYPGEFSCSSFERLFATEAGPNAEPFWVEYTVE